MEGGGFPVPSKALPITSKNQNKLCQKAITLEQIMQNKRHYTHSFLNLCNLCHRIQLSLAQISVCPGDGIAILRGRSTHNTPPSPRCEIHTKSDDILLYRCRQRWLSPQQLSHQYMHKHVRIKQGDALARGLLSHPQVLMQSKNPKAYKARASNPFAVRHYFQFMEGNTSAPGKFFLAHTLYMWLECWKIRVINYCRHCDHCRYNIFHIFPREGKDLAPLSKFCERTMELMTE